MVEPSAGPTIPRYTVYAVSAVLATAIICVSLLSFRGINIGPVATFLAGLLPSCIPMLIAVRQNDRLLGSQQEIKANVNGNLSRLIDHLAASVPTTALISTDSLDRRTEVPSSQQAGKGNG